jgi:hypothetical protein
MRLTESKAERGRRVQNIKDKGATTASKEFSERVRAREKSDEAFARSMGLDMRFDDHRCYVRFWR